MSQRKRFMKRRVARKPPASGRKPTGRLTQRDIAASADELLAFQAHFESLLARREQRDWFRFYMCGQLSNLQRKTMEPLVLALLGADESLIRTAQHFLGQSPWAVAPLLAQAQGLVAEWLGEPDGVVIVDGSGFPKQGSQSVGVARQYCGHLGKIANCQQGVFLLYASRRGHAFLDQRLYVPALWFTAEYQARRQACQLPVDLAFHTEPELGAAMIAELIQRAVVPFRWVTCDARYGEIPTFLDKIAALGKWYLAEVASDTRVWLRTPLVEPAGRGLLGRPRIHPRVKRTAPQPLAMCDLVNQIPVAHWRLRQVKEGSKGPLMAEFADVRVTPIRDELPGQRCWAVFRRSVGPEPEVKYFLSNAPTTCPVAEFVRVSGLRWPIELGLEEGKGEVGMDHYETRTWLGWQHQMTHAILAHLFLVRLQLVIQKKSRAHHCSSPSTHCACHRGRSGATIRHAGHSALPSAPKPRRLLLTSQTNARKPGPDCAKAAQAQNFVNRPDFS